jgi:hypothetical protein
MKITKIQDTKIFLIDFGENKCTVRFAQSVPTGKIYLEGWNWSQFIEDKLELLELESKLLKAVKKIGLHEE